MKKIYSLILGIVILAGFVSCKVDDFNSKYYDPAKTTVVTCDKLMTGAFMSGNGYTFNAYWRMYTWDNYFGKLAQTIGPNVAPCILSMTDMPQTVGTGSMTFSVSIA